MTPNSSRSIRWCLVDNEGRSSAPWLLFRNKKTDDFYLVTKATEGILKVSFHQTGDINIGMTSEAFAKMNLPNSLRHSLRGHRIPQFAPGWTPWVEICVPRSELRHVKGGLPSKTIQIPFHPSAGMTIMKIFLKESAESPMLRMQPHEPIGSIERTDSGSVWVSAFPSELPWDPAERFRDEIEEATEFFQSQDALELKFERDHMWGIDDPTKTIMFLEKAFSIES